MATSQLGKSVFYDLFSTHCTHSDLGPISLNWFEELTAEASPYESRTCGNNECSFDDLHENTIKTPKQKTSIYSQLDSTPVIFKERLLSPVFTSTYTELDTRQNATDNENIGRLEKSNCTQIKHQTSDVFSPSSRCLNESPAVIKEMFKTPLRNKRLHRTPQSDWKPNICSSLFCTPKLMKNQTRGITESLGVEVDPEMSWSSSLATPPSPTVIIAQANDQPKANKNTAIVQSLFTKFENEEENHLPPLLSEVGTKHEEHQICAALQEKSGTHSESTGVTEASAISSRAGWKKTVANAVQDEEVSRTVENALEGMEDVLSFFFASDKTPVLRKVKSANRARRKVESAKSQCQDLSFKAEEERSILVHLDEHHDTDIEMLKELEQDKNVNEKSLSKETLTYEWSQLNLCELDITQPEDSTLHAANVRCDGITVNKRDTCNNSHAEKPQDVGEPSTSNVLTHKFSTCIGKESTLNVECINANLNNIASSSPKPMNSLKQSCTSQHNLSQSEENDFSDISNSGVGSIPKLTTHQTKKPATAELSSVDVCSKKLQERVTINTSFSTLKKQSKFMYSINTAVTGPLERNTSTATRRSFYSHSSSSEGPKPHIKEDQNEPESNSEYCSQKPVFLEKDNSNMGSSFMVVCKSGNISHHRNMDNNSEDVRASEAHVFESKDECKTSLNIRKKVEATAHHFARRQPEVESSSDFLLTDCKEDASVEHESHQFYGHAKQEVSCSRLNSNLSSDMQIKTEVKAFDVMSSTDNHAAKPNNQLRQNVDVSTGLTGNPCSGENVKGSCWDKGSFLHVKQEKNASHGFASSETKDTADFTSDHLSHVISEKSLCEQQITLTKLPDLGILSETFGGFKTASNKKIHISDTNIIKGRDLFKEIELVTGDPNTSNEENKESSKKTPFNIPACERQYKGFKTAANKEIHVSESTFANGRLLFKDIEEESSETAAVKTNDDELFIKPVSSTKPEIIPPKKGHMQQSTGSKYSTENDLLGLEYQSANGNVITHGYFNMSAAEKSFKGFKTASNKDIVVSESTFAKGKLLFEDIEGISSETGRTIDCKAKSIELSTSNLGMHQLMCKKEPSTSENTDCKAPKIAKVQTDLSENYHNMDLKESANSEMEAGRAENNQMTRKASAFSPHAASSALPKDKRKPNSTTKTSSHLNEQLTESQQAEISELSSILENADSQFDFTQFKKGISVAMNGEKQNSHECGIDSQNLNNSDVWKDVDLNDSFAAGRDHLEETKTSVPDCSPGVKELPSAVEYCSKETNASKPDVESLAQNSLVEHERPFTRFNLASGKPVNIDSDVLAKAVELFSDIDDARELLSHPKEECSKSSIKHFSKVVNNLNCEKTEHTSENLVCCTNISLPSTKTLVKDATVKVSGKEKSQNQDYLKCESTDVTNSPPKEQLNEQSKCYESTVSEFSKKGFQTARGKNIMLSESSIQKARHIFAEEYQDNFTLHCNIEKTTQITQCVKERTQFSNVNLEPKHAASEKNIPIESTGKDFMLGFCTAGGKKVSVSDDSLAKARKLFQEECTFSKEGKLDEVIENKLLNCEPFPLLTCEPGLKQRGECFEEISASRNLAAIKPELYTEGVRKRGSNGRVNSSDLAAGEGMPINIGQASLLAGNVLKNLSSQNVLKHGHDVHLLTEHLCAGVKVNKSNDSGHFVNQNLDESNDNQSLCSPTNTVNINKDCTSLAPLSFSTASGKSVTVSHDSLQKARLMLSETANDVIEDINKQAVAYITPGIKKTEAEKEQNNVHNSIGQSRKLHSHSFCTASGKKVNISENSLKQVKATCLSTDPKETSTALFKAEKSILNEGAKDVSTLQNDVAVPKAVSFSTASGKTVQLSDESLKRARAFFSEIDNSQLLQQLNNESPFDERSIGVEMKKSIQTPLTTEKAETTESIKVKVNNGSFGFNTTSGKQVSVSESALKKVKDIFQECDDSVNYEQNKPLVRMTMSSKMKESAPGLKRPAQIPVSSYQSDNVQSKEGNVSTFQDGYANKKSLNTYSEEARRPAITTVPRQHLTPTHISKISTSTSAFPNKSKPDLYVTTSHNTPQNDFEIEAAESARAFLEDDDLTDMGSAADETYLCANQTSNTRTGKRSRTEGPAYGEPPIKRQLLPEFDRTTDTLQQKVILKPLISTPDMLRDRRKFSYSLPLKPSTCNPESAVLRDPGIPSQAQLHPKSKIFHQSLSIKSPDVLSAPTPKSYSPAAARRESVHCLSASKIPAKTFVPPFKKRVATWADNQSSDIQNDPSHGLIENMAEDFSKEDKVETICTLQDRFDDSDILQMTSNLRCSKDLQEMRIRKKQRQKIKAQPGSLYCMKMSPVKRISLESAVEGRGPILYSREQLYKYGVVKNHIGVSSEKASSFQFHCSYYFTKELLLSGNGVQLADGGWLIPTDQGKAGKGEIYRAFCDTPGVDPKLISAEWVYNHYRWIVWKLAAMEVMFPKKFAGRCLTPERVLLQLKYRYDVEIDKSQRSAIKKIMERDDSPAKTLVLCIARIISQGVRLPNVCTNKNEPTDCKESSAVIEATDGWYGINVLLDPSLTALLHKGRLFIGQKLIIHGAELVGSDDACTPLEAPESLMLKIAANSTRPARWQTKLGYFRDPRPFCLHLSSLLSEGGVVGCVDVVIQRIYPMQWMEKMASGLYVFRSDRAEEREAEKHSANQQKKLEMLFSKIQAEFEQREECNRKKGLRRRSLNAQQMQTLQDGAEIYEAIQNEADPGYLESCLNAEQLKALNHHRQLVNDKKQALIQAEFRKAIECSEQDANGCTRRDVTPVWKLRIADYRDQEADATYILNIWRPLPDVFSLLKEGCRYKMYHLSASASKGKSLAADLQLTATKKTRFQQLQPSESVLGQIYSPREATEFSRFQEPLFSAPYAEVDLVGLVISVNKKTGAAPVVYISDETQNFVALKFWTDLGQLGLEEMTKPRTFISANNLRWRSDCIMGIPTMYVGDLANISSNPKEIHLQRAIQKLKLSIQNVQDFWNSSQTTLMKALQINNAGTTGCSKNPSTPTWKSEVSAGSSYLTPLHHSSKRLLSSVDASDLQTENPLCSKEIELKTCKKRKALDFLSRIPSPPPVTPVRPLVSPSLQKAFRPPRSCSIHRLGPETKHSTENVQRTTAKSTKDPAKLEGEFVADEELAMINTQALLLGLEEQKKEKPAEWQVK
ncbi:breast cancer type 2 susceptibility protein isoform X1 [Xenopus laevis]|uniref:Breast cancer type 2 susceptibility protein isoform X1 n=3 Tax=Xenopus laevis TaxID=8355 RepID=A0A1L8HIX3_XENLA|nr:breast cancer type 2 susceptibility protein isoform X1 [Xenopus laevis]XP_018103174.1 breast cancer type 2 susceptibility protein isoform X1 [Xenopus laevis]XP_018103175.1 breast cancer type 2 susceptibility protein isoform X1 [Xenopus laevis]XP_018103176.1 breast cancer type 2 susceptibility protein isoform X1 [Xenopus laevis]XP_018103177.1 breast cancer type 2 susceptibility protein isoform X1 [Xenopus laevis]OCT96028.1 hypothetical protein XELAEV_18013720mg [Xenopus laevis]